MAECQWAILCDYAFLDVARKSCIIGIFDRVFATAVPSALHQSALVVKLLGQPGETIRFRVEIIRPAGGQLAKFEGEARCGEIGVAELQMNMAGLPLPDWGLYGFQIFAGDQNMPIGQANFVLQEPPQIQPANAT